MSFYFSFHHGSPCTFHRDTVKVDVRLVLVKWVSFFLSFFLSFFRSFVRSFFLFFFLPSSSWLPRSSRPPKMWGSICDPQIPPALSSRSMPHNEKVTLGTHRPPYANSADWMKSGGDFFKLLLTKARGKVLECFWCQKVALFFQKRTPLTSV